MALDLQKMFEKFDDDWMTPIEQRKAPRMDVTVKCPCCGNKWVMPMTANAIKCARCDAVLRMEFHGEVVVQDHGRNCKERKR